MNTKIKRKIRKQLQRSLSSKACDFFLNGTLKNEGTFKYRVKLFTGLEL